MAREDRTFELHSGRNCQYALLLAFGALSCLALGSDAASFVGNKFHRQLHQRQHQKNTAHQEKQSAFAKCFAATADMPSSQQKLTTQVEQLKRVLTKEYTSFFDPMERDWYESSVTFQDPLTSLSGVDSYQSNVDMLAGRTLMGKVLFRNAGIVLHSVTGGTVRDSNKIDDIVTRWTLRLTAQILPWQPTARFSGISVYKVAPGGPRGMQIMEQQDYWDSINLQAGGKYDAVDKGSALADFLGQLAPQPTQSTAFPELPYELLRRGKDYDVRRYPAMTALQTTYERRDEAFNELGSLTAAARVKPLAPSILRVPSSAVTQTTTNSVDIPKVMLWPLVYAGPGEAGPPPPSAAITAMVKEDASSGGSCSLISIPGAVVAVKKFEDAATPQRVKQVDDALRQALERDGLNAAAASSSPSLQFAQFDAIFTAGKRRTEVWIELNQENPWK